MSYIQHLKSLGKKALAREIDSKIDDSKHKLIDDEIVIGTMAETNASGYEVNGFAVQSISVGDDVCRAHLFWKALGEQDDGRTHHGNKIRGTADAIVDDEGEVTYREVSAEIEHPDNPRES